MNPQTSEKNKIEQPAQTSTTDAQSVFPVVNDSSTPPTYIASSQIVQEKERLPFGIYLIAAFNLFSFIVSFFDTSKSSNIFTFVMFIDLATAIGLILRLQIARKLMIFVSGLLIILPIIFMFLLIAIQGKISSLRSDYEVAVSRVDKTKITQSQQQYLDSQVSNIQKQEKDLGKVIVFTYIQLGVTIVESAAVIVYLTRPRIKSVFHNIEK